MEGDPAHAGTANPLGQHGLVVPEPVKVVLRGIGQIVFQEHALTGLLFLLGVALSSPRMALGLVAGAAIGTATAWVLSFDRAELSAGIYGFNAALVGIATLFFFQLSWISLLMLLVACAGAACLTALVRKQLPFPTYTAPFIVITWLLFWLGPTWGAAANGPGYGPLVPELVTSLPIESVLHGVGQILFQASVWTGLLFLAGLAVSNRQHAILVLAGSIVGALVAGYHLDAAQRALDPEQLVLRNQIDNIRLGLYGYNATLAAVALFLWRPSVLAPLVGMLFSVPLTELLPQLGVPALTAPFVIATWLVMLMARVDTLFSSGRG